ncbi:probable pectinesterase 29 [Nicotiana tomentosiformis]|uniref:probable pectinesterase 29 n=1 Tax=Nicotiana tomentosiformis TaxID=4098 RepID=UPI0008780BF0|nr:probable pectinesterase 29 [Nicotiana tomentosiformis]
MASFFCKTLVFFFMGFVELGNARYISDFQWKQQKMKYTTVYVDPSGHGQFKTIQSAIDSVPQNNQNWICINIKAGQYREQVKIPREKPYIYLKGGDQGKTSVTWDAHDSIATDATFTSEADNTIVESITFINSYNYPPKSNNNPRVVAVAAMISGDKSVFYRCEFLGLQDTLWDVRGRHYFKLCTIEGAVDFIFGNGQSLYESCTISVNARALEGLTGFITAQGRSNPKDESGFVFKNCNVIGSGQTFLGRPWRDYARVIFYGCNMSNVITPEGWTAGVYVGKEKQLTFAEESCKGMGSSTSKRVQWEAKLSQQELQQLTSLSFIDNEGWITKQPLKVLL